MKTLRQWFYRTSDPALSRRIVETYLARMASAEAPVVRKNLSEGLYIMLDENLGGGVSLQKNLAQLPAPLGSDPGGPARVRARRVVHPAARCAAQGNELQVAAVLEAFDGSFFKGRFYARQPEAMIDVGNDREFGFLYRPDRRELEAVFTRLFQMPLPAHVRPANVAARRFFQRGSRLGRREPSDGGAKAAFRRGSAGSRCGAGTCLHRVGPTRGRGRPAAHRSAAIRARKLTRGARSRASGDRKKRPAGGESRDPVHHPQADRPPRGRAGLAAGAQMVGAGDAEVVSLLERSWAD